MPEEEREQRGRHEHGEEVVGWQDVWLVAGTKAWNPGARHKLEIQIAQEPLIPRCTPKPFVPTVAHPSP